MYKDQRKASLSRNGQTRREFLGSMGGALLSVGPTIATEQGAETNFVVSAPASRPAFGRAQRVLCLFQCGGVSHIDTFDPKPLLEKYHGQPLPAGFASSSGINERILRSTRRFEQCGQSGIEIAVDLFPHLRRKVDQIALIRSVYMESKGHGSALLEMQTGATEPGSPCLGAWVASALGSPASETPAFVVLPEMAHFPIGGASNWCSGSPHAIVAEIPPVSRINETEATQRLYGLERKPCAAYGRRLLYARQLLEQGARFVQVYSGGGYFAASWDAHEDLNANHARRCREIDQPIAGLLTDLEARGLLESTLVLWLTEFGRTPVSSNGTGRNHNPHGFTVWMAGGGIRGGIAYGATDDFGLRAIQDGVAIRDLHATLFHLLGLTAPPCARTGRVLTPLLS